MYMWSGCPSGHSHDADRLSLRDSVPFRNLNFAQMSVKALNSVDMIKNDVITVDRIKPGRVHRSRRRCQNRRLLVIRIGDIQRLMISITTPAAGDFRFFNRGNRLNPGYGVSAVRIRIRLKKLV